MSKLIVVSVVFMAFSLAAFMVKPSFESAAVFACATAFAAFLSHLDRERIDQAEEIGKRLQDIEGKLSNITMATGFRL